MSAATVATSIQQLTDRKVGLQTSNITIQGTNSGVAGTGGLIGIGTTAVFYYQSSAGDIDTEILSRVTSINTKKQQIIDLCQEAYDANCGLGVTVPLPSLDSTLGSASWSIVVDNRPGRCTGIGGTICPFIARTPIYPDLLRAWRLPDLENQSYTGNPDDPDDIKNDPLNSGGYVTISSGSNLGIGKTTVNFPNNSSQSSLGWYYDVSSSGCSGRRAQINTLISEISTIRTGLSTLTSGVNAIKEQKHSSQLGIWGFKYSLTRNNNEITSINAALNVLNNMGNYTS
jgi:hypothetical protein